MSSYDYDLFVVGGGSGGVRAARLAGALGRKVAIAEEFRYGGTCVIRGCVPKKLFVYASHFHEDFEDAAGFGWSVGPVRFNWGTLVANKDKEIARLSGIYERILNNAGVEILHARAELTDAHTVRLVGEDRELTAETILLAVGGRPSLPDDVPGIEHVITSNEAFHLEELPRRIAIVGGGYIAVEFAGIFNGLGVETTLLYRSAEILRGFDMDLRTACHGEMVKKGIDVRVESDPESIEKQGHHYVVNLKNGESVEADLVMYATGREPLTDGLGLDAAGIEAAANGAIKVDEYSRTNVPNIYAIGDVTDRIQLTPVAIDEGVRFVETVFNGNPTPVDHETIPSAVFSQPPIGTCGLTEDEARAKYGALDLYKSSFRPMKHTLSGRDELTVMKLVVDAASQRVVGCHIIGLDAPEMIQCVAIAMKMGATKEQFDATMALHPTAGEELVTMREKYMPPEERRAAE